MWTLWIVLLSVGEIVFDVVSPASYLPPPPLRANINRNTGGGQGVIPWYIRPVQRRRSRRGLIPKWGGAGAAGRCRLVTLVLWCLHSIGQWLAPNNSNRRQAPETTPGGGSSAPGYKRLGGTSHLAPVADLCTKNEGCRKMVVVDGLGLAGLALLVAALLLASTAASELHRPAEVLWICNTQCRTGEPLHRPQVT